MPEPVESYGFLETADYVVIAFYLVLSVGIGMMFTRRGTKNAESYFVGGRGMPWWLIGISLAAACFAADTPLWIGDLIYRRGLEATWLHWATGIGFAFYVFVIAPLWRRSHIITDLEFLELRYSGRAARWLRGLNSLYFSLVFNVMMMGVSTLSITKILQHTTGMDKGVCVAVAVSGALLYCAISGLWGVAAADFLQFFVTWIGSVVLAWFAVRAAGGGEQMLNQLTSMTEWPGHELNVVPRGTAWGLPLMTVLYLFTLRWLDNAAIGAYVSQKLFAARSTKHATLGAMLHGLIYWSIVPIPWLITIAACKVVLPGITDGQQAYPRMAMHVLPLGLKGLLVASMMAAFMSTYAALLTWGSAYAVNDFYRRFLVRQARPRHYVRAGQLFMVPMALISAAIAYKAESIFNLLTYLFMVPAATWTILVARWLWWRVNAWAEVAALSAGVVLTAVIWKFFPAWMAPATQEQYFGHKFIVIVLGGLVAWVITTLATPPTDRSHLESFARRVNPPGFWRPVRDRLGLSCPLGWGGILYGWAVMMLAIYGPTLGLVKTFFGSPREGLLLVGAGCVGIGLSIRRARALPEEADAQSAPERSPLDENADAAELAPEPSH